MEHSFYSKCNNAKGRNAYLSVAGIISKYILIGLLLIILSVSCKKLVEMEAPVTSVNEANVYSNDATATSVMTGIYVNMSKSGVFTGSTSISLLSGLSADEFTLGNAVSDPTLVPYYRNQIITVSGAQNWGPLYKYIFQCNAVVEGVSKSSFLSSIVKDQLIGEAKFMRAFCYYYLVNLFGDVPLALTTDHRVNSTLYRNSKSQVYQHILEDLNDAVNLLNPNYLNGSLKEYTGNIERVRPIKWAATALLARVSLYLGDYINAETYATTVINNSFYSLDSLNGVFLKNSKEAIWQLQPVTTGRNTEDARVYILTGEPSNSKPVYLNNSFLLTFESADQRKVKWMKSITVNSNTYFYPFKYKIATNNAPLTEYLMVLRLGEQYLIRSEARAQQNNISGAQSDLNEIRKRAGLSGTTATDKTSLLIAVLQERRLELFSEWGHRWLDIKRTASVDAVMNIISPSKSSSAWQSYQQLYPIPIADIQKNSNLEQNIGYQK